jgi:hypothetical protein
MIAVGSMFWMSLATGVVCETIGPAGWASVQGPAGLSATATPMAKRSLASLTACSTGA